MQNQSNRAEHINLGLTAINILVSVSIAVVGYAKVTRVQQSLDTAHLQIDQTKSIIDVAKFPNDLRPNIKMECSAHQEGPITARVDCSENNIGTQRALLDAPTVKLRQADQDAYYNTNSFKVTELSQNALPAGAAGSISYKIEALGLQEADWSKVIVETTVAVRTDPSILTVVKDNLHTTVSEDQLGDFSVQNFMRLSAVTPLQKAAAAPAVPENAVAIPSAASPASQ